MAPHKPTLRELATPKPGNPSQLGDPVSLKAETADSRPTENDAGASSPPSSSGAWDDKNSKAGARRSEAMGKTPGKGKTLKEMVENNPSALGDPVSLKAEKSDSEPTENDKGAGKTKSKL